MRYTLTAWFFATLLTVISEWKVVAVLIYINHVSIEVEPTKVGVMTAMVATPLQTICIVLAAAILSPLLRRRYESLL